MVPCCGNMHGHLLSSSPNVNVNTKWQKLPACWSVLVWQNRPNSPHVHQLFHPIEHAKLQNCFLQARCESTRRSHQSLVLISIPPGRNLCCNTAELVELYG